MLSRKIPVSTIVKQVYKWSGAKNAKGAIREVCRVSGRGPKKEVVNRIRLREDNAQAKMYYLHIICVTNNSRM